MQPDCFAESSSDDSKAAFNMAIATLYRMDTLLKQSNIYSQVGLLDSWKVSLDTLHREISPYLKLEESKSILESKKGVNVFMEKYQRLQDKNRVLPTMYNRKVINDFYAVLYDFDMLLRKFMNEHDLLIPKRSDPRFSVMKGGR